MLASSSAYGRAGLGFAIFIAAAAAALAPADSRAQDIRIIRETAVRSQAASPFTLTYTAELKGMHNRAFRVGADGAAGRLQEDVTDRITREGYRFTRETVRNGARYRVYQREEIVGRVTFAIVFNARSRIRFRTLNNRRVKAVQLEIQHAAVRPANVWFRSDYPQDRREALLNGARRDVLAQVALEERRIAGTAHYLDAADERRIANATERPTRFRKLIPIGLFGSRTENIAVDITVQQLDRQIEGALDGPAR